MGFQILDANQPNDPYMQFLKAVAVGDVTKHYEPIIRTEELKYYEATVIEKLAEENQNLRDTIRRLNLQFEQSEEQKKIALRSKKMNSAELFQIKKKLDERTQEMIDYENDAKELEFNNKLNMEDKAGQIVLLQNQLKLEKKKNEKIQSELEAVKDMLSVLKMESKKKIVSLEEEVQHHKKRADIAEEKLIRYSLDTALYEKYESEKLGNEAKYEELEKKIDTMTFKLDRAVEGEASALKDVEKYKKKSKKLEKSIKPLKYEIDRQQKLISTLLSSKKSGGGSDGTFSSSNPSKYLPASPTPTTNNKDKLKLLKRGSTMSQLQNLKQQQQKRKNESPSHHMKLLDGNSNNNNNHSNSLSKNSNIINVNLNSNSAETSPRNNKNSLKSFKSLKSPNTTNTFSPSSFNSINRKRNGANHKKMNLDHIKSRYLNTYKNQKSSSNNNLKQLPNESTMSTITSPLSNIKNLKPKPSTCLLD
mmetsp:Transcript_8589/g.12662  ORF Transcript_8589/g.12662 Transcript_8589/m.12662 type:complete len:476 (-) Transcript_8589:72-1499(-)